MITLVHYAELFLKGKNRRSFERRLQENIRLATGGTVEMLEGRMVVEGGDPALLSHIPGIEWFARATRVPKDTSAMAEHIVRELGPRVLPGKTFAVRVTRADKAFPVGSMETASMLGQVVVDRYGLAVDLDNPDITVNVEIAEECYVYFERTGGIGGLPVGSSGRALCLLSGGIDSPVAAFSMMKRGCRVDLIHFHALATNEAVMDTKIAALARHLGRLQNGIRLFVVPYAPFQLALFAASVGRGYEMVLFRRFILRFAEWIARLKGYKALVTGDSVGQVASQTLENLEVAYDAVSIPVLHPLISFNKREIIDLARDIGTYETSIEPYRDCCSIIVAHPKTRVTVRKIEGLESTLDTGALLSRSRELMSVWEAGPEGLVEVGGQSEAGDVSGDLPGAVKRATEGALP